MTLSDLHHNLALTIFRYRLLEYWMYSDAAITGMRVLLTGQR